MANNLIICVDFGASRVKAAVFDLNTDSVVRVHECISPSSEYKGKGNKHEVPVEAYWKCFENCTAPLLSAYPDISELYICSEMHGFVLWDLDNKLPLTDYISWQDQRVTQETSLYQNIVQFSDVFFQKTGMKLKPGLPAVVTAYFSAENIFKNNHILLCTLVDWLLLRGGCEKPFSNVTLAAGTGFYNIDENTWDRDLIQGLVPNMNLSFCEITDAAFLGSVVLNGKKIGVYGGFGDFQAALRGMDFGQKGSAAINLGTGSQVALFRDTINGAGELRPWDTKLCFQTITHIPSGRAINVFKKIIDNFFTLACTSQDGVFWDIWSSLTVDEVMKAPLQADLNIFPAAWKYNGTSGYIQIKEGVVGTKSIVASIALSWLKQYAEALNNISDNNVPDKVIVGGGFVRRADFIVPVLSNLLDRGMLTIDNTVDETLLGLIKFAKQIRK